MTHDRDEWLMSQVALGRQGDLEILVRRYANPLLTFIRRMIGDHHRSEEVFQNVFIAVWRKRKQYRMGRPFKPWLYAIAVNACREEFRRRPVSTVPIEELAITVEDSPGDVAVAAERATIALAAVAELAPKQRCVVVLRIWSGLSYAAIGEALECSEGTVRAHMHQALRNLRNYLEPRLR